MENHEMLLNSGFSCALPSFMEPYLEKATYRRNTTHTFCFFWMDVLVKTVSHTKKVDRQFFDAHVFALENRGPSRDGSRKGKSGFETREGHVRRRR